ncbi:MAG: DUF262 domain-containing protein [Patescibacteria group bacterium]
MNIELKNIKVRDVVDGYNDNGEGGVVGYGGKLNIRPAFQREFIYGNKERDAVIKTVRQGFPLNTMYWAKTDEGNFELMDGQQRTISVCQYITDIIPIKFDEGHELAFNNLTADQQQRILNYELSVYVCDGTDSDKLDWFKTINIAGKPLTEQELRNAIYTGPWLADAKRWFSKTNGPADQLGEKYLNGSPIRQDYLEKALDWISGGKIENYMSKHQQDDDAQELWQYFQEVVSWTERVFPEYRKIMKGLEWGRFYNKHKNDNLNAAILEKRIAELIEDNEVDSKKGIYEYLLTGDEKTLNLRVFDEKTKIMQYEKQKGICVNCKKYFEINEMEADHITPWCQGGKTIAENCQMLCKDDNRRKSDR